MGNHGPVDRDEVGLTAIEHQCEELTAGEEPQQECNCIVYHFERASVYFWARANVDDIETVSIYGPFENRHSMNRIAGCLDDGVLSYLKAAFQRNSDAWEFRIRKDLVRRSVTSMTMVCA